MAFTTNLKLGRPPSSAGEIETRKLLSNYQYIKKQVGFALLEGNEDSCELECSLIQIEHLKFDNYQSLLRKVNVIPCETRHEVLNTLERDIHTAGLLRLLLFSSYLNHYVVLTRIETRNEDYAFDIFDSLNTTGEPLTALETFKPKVVQFENQEGGYTGSESEEYIEDIFSYIDDRQWHKETKDLLTSFALYLDGHRLPGNLSVQRTYLRQNFDSIETLNLESKRGFVSALRDMAHFRSTVWNTRGIGQIQLPSSVNQDGLQLCLRFIFDMKTSLSLPLLARYWSDHQFGEQFIFAVQAVTAFIVLRRSVTGGTENIDSDFRTMMQESFTESSVTWCIGKDFSNPLPAVERLKEELRRLLKRSTGVTNKKAWIEQVIHVPLANHSRPLCRLLLFAATHQTNPDEESVGLLVREGVVPSDELIYLDYKTWNKNYYATVEHVAPSAGGSNWDDAIYDISDPAVDTIGNLILLPRNENTSIGDAKWDKKKVFYKTLTAKKMESKEALIAEAESMGFKFSKSTQRLLREGERLPMLDSISEVAIWDKDFIKRRSQNTLELAWESIAPWLFCK